MKMSNNLRVERIKNAIKVYTDFPKKGILFRDMFLILLEPSLFSDLIQELENYIKKNHSNVEAIVGIESRGFLIGPILALNCNVPFIPARKPGKLPGSVKRKKYKLEYGIDTLEIQSEPIKSGLKCLILDDLIATGGSMDAAVQLVKECGGQVIGCLVVMELVALNGRKHVSSPLYSMIQY